MAPEAKDQIKYTKAGNNSNNPTIILAGATGNLGKSITRHLLLRGANVRALIRPESSPETVTYLNKLGASVSVVDFNNISELTKACAGGSCVVSSLSGLRDVIVDSQERLVEAAVAAGVPRFIPSDFSIDFTKLQSGTNRNLDLRREFSERLNKAPIQATSILNGMFADLLIGPAPVVLFPVKRVLYYGNADQAMDFTTLENTAEFTAAAALDRATPRYLRIAADVLSARGLRDAASQATGKKFGLLRPGGLWLLAAMIKITRTLSPSGNEVFPAWQGMQYMHDMFSGLPKLEPLDNERYPDIRWTKVHEVLAARKA